MFVFYVTKLIRLYISVIHIVLLLIFGQNYRNLLDRVIKIYWFVTKVMSTTVKEPDIQSLSERLERTEERLLAVTNTIEWHVLALQNQIISLEKQVYELKKAKLAANAYPKPVVPQRRLIMELAKTLAHESIGRFDEQLTHNLMDNNDNTKQKITNKQIKSKVEKKTHKNFTNSL